MNNAWLEGVRHHPSAHYDERPKAVEIELLVIHAISLPPGQFGGPFIEQLFTHRLNICFFSATGLARWRIFFCRA